MQAIFVFIFFLGLRFAFGGTKVQSSNGHTLIRHRRQQYGEYYGEPWHRESYGGGDGDSGGGGDDGEEDSGGGGGGGEGHHGSYSYRRPSYRRMSYPRAHGYVSGPYRGPYPLYIRTSRKRSRPYYLPYNPLTLAKRSVARAGEQIQNYWRFIEPKGSGFRSILEHAGPGLAAVAGAFAFQCECNNFCAAARNGGG